MLLTRSRRCGRTSCHQFHRSRTKMADDPIKAFLETSGLTPEDLIRRLAQYQNNSETVLEEIVQVKREPSSPVHTPIDFTETILISDSDDEDDDGSRREPERIEICESDEEVLENKSKLESGPESDSGRLKRRLSEVEDAVPKKSRRRSEEDKFELYEGKDLDTFILKNRLGDIFEDSSPRGRVSVDLVSNETGESEVVGNSTSIDESRKSASPSQDLDSVNKIVTQVDEQNPQKTSNEEECTISKVRCEAGEVTQNEKCTVNEPNCDPGISRLNRPQNEISKAADEVIDLDLTTSKTNDLSKEADVTVTTKESRTDDFIDLDQMTIKTNEVPEEAEVTVATEESRNNYSRKSETVDKVIDLDETTVKTNDLSKEADVNTATKECRSDDSEKIVDVTEEIEAVKEDEDSSCLDNVLDSLLRLVEDDGSGERTKVTSDDVETTGQSSSNNIEKDVLRIKIDEEVVQNDKDQCLDECTRLDVQKGTEVESIAQKDKETIASVDLVDKEVVQKDEDESARVKMDVLIDKCADVALKHENLDSSNLHLPKNPQKIVDLTVSSDSSDLEVEKVENLPSKDGLLDDKLDEPRRVEAADALGAVDSLKNVFDAGKIKDFSDSDVFEDTKVEESPGEPHKDKYMNVDLQKVEDTTAGSNLNVFQCTNNDGEVDSNSCTQLNAEKIDETSSASSDLDVLGDVIDRIRKVDSLGSSSSNSDLHKLVKEVDSSTDSSGDGDVFEKQYRARLKDPRILRREIEKYDAWCTENAKFDKFSFIKSDFNDGEANADIIDVDKVECNGKTDDSEDVELITKDVEVIDVDEIEEKSDGTAGRSDEPGEFVKLEVEEDAVERTEDDGSNVKDFHDDINDGSKTELSGRSSPSLSTLELNSDISDVDVENNRVEAESYVDEAETVDLTFEHSTEKKLPTVGTIRKSVGKRTARVFRPPWLKADDVDEQDVASDVAEPQVELRPKPLGPLVDIRTSIPETYHKRRTKTPEPPAEPSLFDIKIVDVKSGADVDIRTAIAQIRDRRRRNDVINEELKGDVITLTKTSDFTKIKGWRRKKLLIKSETDIDVDYGEVDNVFASDNLDGFLDRQKNLNISYNVPNLKSSNHSNVDYLDDTVIMHDSSADEKGRFESRRRFTMAENEQVNCINQNAKTDPFKPRTLAEKRKLLSREIKPEPPSSHSLVYYRGKAFKVPSKYEKNITVHGENRTKYRYTYTSAKPLKKTKPSIYTTNLSRTVAIKYKPGPMSKKQVLDSNWTPVVKKLPRVRLCVVPEYRVPLHPRAAQFVKFETFEVTSERVEFALGALPGKGAGTCFDVPYKNNQKTVLLLKAAEVVAPEVKPEPPPVKIEEENVEDVVRKMLGDMVDYVELKEVGESIVEEDHSYEPQAKETSPTKPGAKRSSRTEVIKGSTKKTNLELKRLNVKIIEVNIEDGADDGVGCTKSHCRLGCVCKSLRAPVFPQDHCGKRQCIFGCVCGFERSRNRRMKFVLPSGTDILSETTVSRLQDEAKKNLAKVEKEFTQTVIHANNQTIVVGEKTDRKRRPLKTPKKYEDYIEPVILGEEDQPQEATTVSPMKPIVVELPRKRKRSPPPPETTVIPCRVVVHKLDLEHVLPLCLEHNLYDCHCGGWDSYSKTTTSVSLSRPTTVSSARPTPSTTPVDEGKEVGEKAERKKVIREKREKDSEWCSRTKGAPYSIVQRNRTFKYKKTLAHKLRRSENADAHSLDISARWLKDPVDDVVEQIAIDNAVVCKDEPENGGTRGRKKKRRKMPELIPIKEDTTAQIDQDPLLEPLGTGSLESTKPSRRKQVLMTREQMGEMMKKKAVEEKAKAKAAKWKALCEPQPPQQPSQQPPKQQPQPRPQQVLGEAVVPLHSDLNQKVKDLLGNSNDVLRIIPWRLLLQKYLSGTIEIWCWPAFQKFVLTDPKVFLTKAWLNVRQHEADAGTCEMRDLDFFKWIVDRRTNDESQSVFIILQKTSACWEVRGVVRKSGAGSSVLKSSRPETTTTISPTQTTESATTEGETTESLTNQPEATQSAIEPTSTESETTETETTTELARSQSPSTIDEVTRKTQEYVGEANQQYKQVPHLDILTRMFRFQLLRSEEHGDYEVRLPRVHGGARWRMLQVSNFSHLAFKRNSYRIKATNIMVAMKEAQKTGKTAILLNEYIRKNYGSMIFGVYACCFQLNKVFIGPYGMDEDHDLETLRFVNNVLVNTDVVDKMRNAGGQSTNGCWFVQVVLKKKKNTDQPAEAPAAVTHKMNESEYALLSTFDAAATMFTDTLKSLMTAARLRLPHSAVPLALKANFDDGFIHAFKYPGHDAIFVYWPGGRLDEPQKFDTKDVALEWVVGNLKKTFVAVPNFTITAKFVKVSDFVENSTCSTMSRNYFDELHIVGPFGAVRMVNVADYLIHPEKKHPPELVDVIKEFCLGSDDLSKTDFLESMLVQTKADVSVELTKSSKLGDEKRNLEKKRNDLLLKIKALKPALKTNPVVSSQEVICLDSDDETTTTEAPKTTVTPQSPTKSFTKLSDALQQTSNPVKVRNNVVLYQMKGGAQLTRKTYSSAAASKPRKMPTIKSVRPMQPFAEKIDLSHLDPAKVQRLLGSTDLTSGRVLLTGEQLRNLRALSKVKVAVTPTTESAISKVKTTTTETSSTETDT